MEVFLARQAIFDRQRHVYGYELLFRSCLKNTFNGADPSASTRQVVSNSLLAIGLDRIAGHKKVFVNVGRDLLLDEFPAILPKHQMILEILDSGDLDPAILAACESLRQQGYLLALSAFAARPEQRPFLKHAHFVKVDIRTRTDQDHLSLVHEYHAHGLIMVAEKVETLEDYQRAKAAGYDCFQGYYFARPQMIIGRQIPAIKLNCLRLLREILRPELNYDRLASLISADVSLTYQLLRFVGSYLFSAGGRIETVQQALVYLGENQLRRWVALAAIPRAATDKPEELLKISLLGACFSESIATLAGISQPEEAFLMGLFAHLDALLDRPLEESLQELRVDPAITDALLDRGSSTDPLSRINRLVRCYTTADWDAVPAHAAALGLDPSAVATAYVQAAEWADRNHQPATAR